MRTHHMSPLRPRLSTWPHRSMGRAPPHCCETGRAARSSWPAFPSGCSSSVGCSSISFCSCREEALANNISNPLRQRLPDGVVPEEEITRVENRWVAIMLAMLAVMMAVIVVTGINHSLHPPSNAETMNPKTYQLNDDFGESNLGTAAEPDGSVTV